MSNSLEAEIDQLFQALPSAMVEARNALADRLRKAGDKAGAAQVKALKRPAPAAWALNQVHFRAPELLARARAETEAVRALHAQDAVDPRALMAAHEAQRSASKAVVETALRYAEDAGIPIHAAQQRRVLATLQGLLAGASEEPAGRLTRELEPSGFDAIENVGFALPRGARPVEAPIAQPSRPAAAVRPVDDATALRAAAETQLRSCERTVREAEAIVHKRRSAQQRGQIELDEARAAEAAAEEALRAARLRREAREAEFQAHRVALEQAEAALGKARAQLSQAQRRVAPT